MISTDKETCFLLAAILYRHGLRNVVICPGARDLPLVTAFVKHGKFDCVSITDEREAAFFALGIAQMENRPVAVVCTSGSAVLNFAPAVSESYYKNLPLIVISADRPLEWIDQADSQTIRQDGCLSSVVKSTLTLPETIDNDDARWFAQRLLNEACITAVTHRKGPVHINVPLSLPLNRTKDYPDDYPTRFIANEPAEARLSKEQALKLAATIQKTNKVLLVAGYLQPDDGLKKSVEKLLRLPNVALLCENLANLHIKDFDISPDSLLQSIDEVETESVRPDLIISFGGSLVSKKLKTWIRGLIKGTVLWYVGEEDNVTDTFGILQRRIEMCPAIFFNQVASSLRKSHETARSDYSACFKSSIRRLKECQQRYLIDNLQWCDLGVLNRVLKKIPRTHNLQVSNGMSVRYLMSLAESYGFHRVDCNRGVSGIDGCTSTALGAAYSFKGTTVLISGDMSARYDMGAIVDAAALTKNFKMLILQNGGGEIFNFIKSGEAEIRNRFLVETRQPDWKVFSESNGWRYFEASSFGELDKRIVVWLEQRDAPSLLVAKTTGDTNVECFRNYQNIKI